MRCAFFGGAAALVVNLGCRDVLVVEEILDGTIPRRVEVPEADLGPMSLGLAVSAAHFVFGSFGLIGRCH